MVSKLASNNSVQSSQFILLDLLFFYQAFVLYLWMLCIVCCVSHRLVHVPVRITYIWITWKKKIRTLFCFVLYCVVCVCVCVWWQIFEKPSPESLFWTRECVSHEHWHILSFSEERMLVLFPIRHVMCQIKHFMLFKIMTWKKTYKWRFFFYTTVM